MIELEVNIKDINKFINLLWKHDILVRNIKRKNIATITFTIVHEDFAKVKDIVLAKGGKIKILKRTGKIYLIRRLLNIKSLLIGAVLFVGILYYLSTFVFSIDITSTDNISPFEIREDLKKLNIASGMKKSAIDVYKLEDDLLKVNKNILWVRARIEGSTLKIVMEEKVNPPKINVDESKDIIAKRNGEIDRIFVSSGTAKVEKGDIVKEGDVLIQGLQGKEGEEYEVKSKGVVIANTFYEREMEVQISGEQLVLTGEEREDIYISILGKRLYLKKIINKYDNYDKIEEEDGYIKKIRYCKKEKKEVNESKDDAIENAKLQLKESLLKNLDSDCTIKNENVNVTNIDKDKIRVTVVFLVEENIAQGIT